MGQQTNIALGSPGFLGINTEMNPTSISKEWALIAQNCVVDRAGRLATRKGFVSSSSNPEILNDQPLEGLEILYGKNGVNTFFVVGDNRIFIHTSEVVGGIYDPTTMYEMTLPVGYVIANNNWQMVSFNNVMYFVQEGQQPLFWVNKDFIETDYLVLTELEQTGNKPNLNEASCSCAAFGRLWLGGFTADRNILRWSALLDGTTFADGDYLDLAEVWPTGFDSVIAIHAHNNYLIIFGLRSMLVYNVPDDGVAFLSLADTVSGLGCVARDSVRSNGKDVWFLDSTGVRSFARTIQEKSLPIGDVTSNVRTELIANINKERALSGITEATKVRTWFSGEEGLYVLILPTANITYVLDTKTALENGAYRVTKWDIPSLRAGARGTQGRSGGAGFGGLYLYNGRVDVFPDGEGGLRPAAIDFVYQTGFLDFGSPANLIFPKQADVTIFGAATAKICLGWSFDYKPIKNTICKTFSGAKPTFFNNEDTNTKQLDGDWENIYSDENGPLDNRWLYSSADQNLLEVPYSVWGQGKNISLRLSSSVSDNFAVQEINLQATSGRLV